MILSYVPSLPLNIINNWDITAKNWIYMLHINHLLAYIRLVLTIWSLYHFFCLEKITRNLRQSRYLNCESKGSQMPICLHIFILEYKLCVSNPSLTGNWQVTFLGNTYFLKYFMWNDLGLINIILVLHYMPLKDPFAQTEMVTLFSLGLPPLMLSCLRQRVHSSWWIL